MFYEEINYKKKTKECGLYFAPFLCEIGSDDLQLISDGINVQ